MSINVKISFQSNPVFIEMSCWVWANGMVCTHHLWWLHHLQSPVSGVLHWPHWLVMATVVFAVVNVCTVCPGMPPVEWQPVHPFALFLWGDGRCGLTAIFLNPVSGLFVLRVRRHTLLWKQYCYTLAISPAKHRPDAMWETWNPLEAEEAEV